MKIVHLCEFSSGICGTWTSVFETAKRQTKKHQVYVLSSNLERGSGKTAKGREIIDNVKIVRFPVKFSLSMNYLFWDFERELQEINPDIIHTHVYRHWHSTKALKIGERLGIPVVLTTHAPFNRKRGIMLTGLKNFYDTFIGKKALKKYDAVIAITKWEKKFLEKLGCRDQKIHYIPNGIPTDFFEEEIDFEENKNILYLGRLAPLKRIDTIMVAIKDLDVMLKLAGPAEGDYGSHLKWLAKKLGVDDKVQFLGPVYDMKKKIRLYENSLIFVLASETEGMPQALIEAMSLGRVVFGADNDGIREVLDDEEFLFKVGDYKELRHKINKVLENPAEYKEVMRKNREKSKKYNWDEIIEKIEEVYLKFKK